MTYSAIYAASTDTTFQGRCAVALWKAAQDILAEDAQTPNHAQRVNWARTALAGRLEITPQQLAVQVLRNPTIAADPAAASDGDLQFQVNSILADLLLIG